MDTNITKYKYPRTPHLPYSASRTDDDKVLASDAHFYQMDKVVVTIKMDGENTTVYPNGYCHARSVDSKHKEYHSWLIQNIQNWCYMIPESHRVCGEYLYAKHSIYYDNLKSYFMGFSVWENGICLDWAKTTAIFDNLRINSVPVMYIGIYDRNLIQGLAEDVVAQGHEGIVVRNYDSYSMNNVSDNIAKYVRPNHIQTTEHWSLGIIEQNKLI